MRAITANLLSIRAAASMSFPKVWGGATPCNTNTMWNYRGIVSGCSEVKIINESCLHRVVWSHTAVCQGGNDNQVATIAHTHWYASSALNWHIWALCKPLVVVICKHVVVSFCHDCISLVALSHQASFPKPLILHLKSARCNTELCNLQPNPPQLVLFVSPPRLPFLLTDSTMTASNPTICC